MRRARRAPILVLLLLVPWLSEAQEVEGARSAASAPVRNLQTTSGAFEPGASLRVYLITIGWGDAIWQRFGHNALWIEDEETGAQAAYNWGVFDFGQVDFIPRLAKGTMLYRMEVFDPMGSLDAYRADDRPVWMQELSLTPAQKLELLAFVQWTARPENKYYRYDYYLDNCSTRIRDALNQVLDDRIFSTFGSDTTGATFRWHTRRLLRGVPAAYLGIQFVLGPKADRPITTWEEMFLPLSLMDGLRDVEIPDGSGGTRPLVTEERVLFQGTRLQEPEDPPPALPIFLGIGLLWGAGLLWFSRSGYPESWVGRLGPLVLGGGWALIAGLSGSLLLLAWAFTDHTFWYQNLNLFQTNPLFLPASLAFLLFLFRGRFPRWGKHLALVLGGLSLLGGLLFLLSVPGQKNGEILGLTLPLNLALWAVSSRLPTDTESLVEAAGPGGE